MYCDRCGSSLSAGSQFCSVCGRALTPGPVVGPAGAVVARAVPSEARVQRHIQLVAGLWAANGILRLVEVCWMMVAGRLFFPFMREWGGANGWPFGRWGLDSLIWGGIYTAGILMGVLGAAHLLLAWGLFERQPWARALGIVLGFLALLRMPFGTALGIYTLWVLLPESSGREYEVISRGGGQLNSARTSS
jgi:hypothetical protein